jgi:hypothetical protein
MEQVINHIHSGIDAPKISTNNIVVNSFLTTPSENPTEDYQVANKAYCDLVKTTVASGNLKTSSDAEITYANNSYEKKKEIVIYAEGTVRVSFAITTNSGVYSCLGRIYINGSAVGIERVASSTYPVYTEDFTVHYGDLVQLYCYSASAVNAYCKNFRMSYDVSLKDLSTVIT